MFPMFHPIEGLTQAETAAANVREFKGDGSPYLHVPGLKKLAGVRVGPQIIPLEIEQRIPTSPSLTEFETVKTPLVVVETAPTGERILLRSIQSNNGIWQDGMPVYVAGEWDAEGGEEPATDPKKNEKTPKS